MSVPGGPTNWVIVQQGPTVCGWRLFEYFSLICHFSFSFSLGDGQRYIEISSKEHQINQPTTE